jgi:hypothetical protein
MTSAATPYLLDVAPLLSSDFYLASLAAKHGMQLATLDEGIKHKAAFVIPG